LEGNIKPSNPYCGLSTIDRWTNDRLTNQQPAAEELKYSRDWERRNPQPNKNLFKVWQNMAIFGGRPINGAVEVLLTKIINWQY
jgi:hypothetical protein